ncbi:MAG TPA: hypothetical protein VE465_21770 [Streptosporangiaceae bacterium]|nr:hypothetical protein [Streptosporangiaceae bacterium]
MLVTDEQVAALRAYLVDDEEESDRLIGYLEQSGGLDGFSALFGSAFFDAVNRRFAPTWSVAEVVRFVATVRAHHLADPNDLDPLNAERLIRTALGDGSVDDLDDEIRAAQMILLPVLIHEEQPNPVALEDILAQARRRANSLPL